MTNRNVLKIALLSFLLLQGCGKGEPEAISRPSAVVASPEVVSALSAFDNTGKLKESTLQRAASTLLLSRTSISSSQAETCIDGETERPSIREICAVLVAAGKGDLNLRLSEFILKGGKQSPTLAAAIGLRPELLRGTAFEDALAYLIQLKEQPAWFRVRLLLDWGKMNGGLAPEHARYAADFLRSSRALSPLSLSYVFNVLASFDQSRFREEAYSYCREDAAGELRIRCWRLLGALAKTPLANNASNMLAAYMPKKKDETWTIFERSFPDLAPALSNLYNPETR